MIHKRSTALERSVKIFYTQFMAILEKQVGKSVLASALASKTGRAVVVYAMVIVQGLDKPKTVKTYNDLSENYLCQKVTRLFNGDEEVQLAFDRLYLERSLQTETRTRRLAYLITNLVKYVKDTEKIYVIAYIS